MKVEELGKEVEKLFSTSCSIPELPVEIIRDSLMAIGGKKIFLELVLQGLRKMERKDINNLYEKLLISKEGR